MNGRTVTEVMNPMTHDSETPRAPRSVAETGLSTAFLFDLAIKTLYYQNEMQGSELAEALRLPFNVLEETLESLKRERLIEVKTTGLGKFFPFYVTANEVRCSEDMTDKFHLFRVFDFGRTPRVYILTGSLKENCQLEPTQYRATI